jgi:positive regulator of sigma E activity
MDFEELQVIWNNQNNEKMYAINENALNNYIRKKGKSIGRMLNVFEFILIAVNLFVGIWLTIESMDNNPWSNQLILAVFYLAFAVYGLIRRFMRRNDERPFATTVVGELDKAIWRIDYLMQRSRNTIFWYLLPLVVIFAVMSVFDNRLIWVTGMLLFVTVGTYFTDRWEFNKFHLPNKHNLEALREKLTAKENQ